MRVCSEILCSGALVRQKVAAKFNIFELGKQEISKQVFCIQCLLCCLCFCLCFDINDPATLAWQPSPDMSWWGSFEVK